MQFNNKLSVLISLYHNSIYDEFILCFNSILNQTLLPDEIIVVYDGAIPNSIDQYLVNSCKRLRSVNIFLNIIKLKNNIGLGDALNVGLYHSRNNIIVRVDSDDVNFRDRFEKQLSYFLSNKVDVLGGAYEEFNITPGDKRNIKLQPFTNTEILLKSKFLNPMSHPTVMFSKEAVINSGSYKKMLLFEDYFLWIRMMKFGYKFANMSDSLIYFRVGNGMIARRHGLKYYRHELNFYFNSYKLGHIGIFNFIFIASLKFFLRFLPIRIMNFFYVIFNKF